MRHKHTSEKIQKEEEIEKGYVKEKSKMNSWVKY